MNEFIGTLYSMEYDEYREYVEYLYSTECKYPM